MFNGVSGDRVLDYMLYGVPSEKSRKYFANQLHNLSSILPENNWIVNNFQNVYNSIYSNDAIEEAKNVLRKSSSQFREDILHEISFDHYTPNYITQRYIMACPEIWNLHNKGLSNDFDMQYTDLEPDIKDIHWRSDYMDVMDGILNFEKDGSGYFEHFYREETSVLSLTDRMVILNNWEIARAILDSGEDPTVIKT